MGGKKNLILKFLSTNKIKKYFSFHVGYICVSFPVILFITGEAAPAALPAHAGRAALPHQTLQLREHHGRGGTPLPRHETALPQPEVGALSQVTPRLRRPRGRSMAAGSESDVRVYQSHAHVDPSVLLCDSHGPSPAQTSS